jgi:hypothetical protein
VVPTRYGATLALYAPGQDGAFTRIQAAEGYCLLQWTGKQASGVIYLDDPSAQDGQTLKLPISVDNSKAGVLHIEALPESTWKFSAAMKKSVESGFHSLGPAIGGEITLLCWMGWPDGLAPIFAKGSEPGYQTLLTLKRAFSKKEARLTFRSKIPANPDADYFAFQYVGEAGALAGRLELVVKTGKELEAKKLLEDQNLDWRIYPSIQWIWYLEVPNFSEGFWAKKLYDSQLFDLIVRAGAPAKPRDEIVFYCPTSRVFSTDPWTNSAEAQQQSREYFTKIVTQAFGEKPQVTIDWMMADAKPHRYSATVTGPSEAVGRGAAGLWEQHQFRMELSDAQAFRPSDERKRVQRKDYIKLSVTQVACKTASGASDAPPPLQQYNPDQSQESILFLRNLCHSLMEKEEAVIEPGGKADVIFENVTELRRTQEDRLP